MSASFRNVLIMAVAVAALSGCTTTDDAKCPLASSLVDTASLTQLAQGGRPLYTAQVQKVDADCDISKNDHTVQSSLDITFTATRPDSGGSDSFDAPYFVAVTLGGRVLSKHQYTAHISFDSGQTSASLEESRDSPIIHMEKGKHPYDYAVLVGFQLTPDQFSYNRTVGRYPK
jgi:hypothetical protein